MGKWPKPDAKLIQALGAESDRGCVLVAAAFLDEQVKVLLKLRYSTDHDARQTLIDEVLTPTNMTGVGTANWCINRAVRIGLMPDPEIPDALRQLCTVRNEFAHQSHRGDLVAGDVSRIHKFLKSHTAAIDHWIDATRKDAVALAKQGKQLSDERIRFIGITMFLWCETWELIKGVVIPLAAQIEESEKIGKELRTFTEAILATSHGPGFSPSPSPPEALPPTLPAD